MMIKSEAIKLIKTLIERNYDKSANELANTLYDCVFREIQDKYDEALDFIVAQKLSNKFVEYKAQQRENEIINTISYSEVVDNV